MTSEKNGGIKTNETPTCGIFYCRDGAKIIGRGLLQTSS